MLAMIKMALELLPVILSAVRAIEEAIPESGKGAEKLALVRETIESVSDTASEAWPMVEKLVGIVVAFLNRVGVFTKS